MSSKRPVPVLRQSIDVVTAKPRDPRFESLSGGAYNDDRFKRQYSFLYDEKLPEEKRALREALKHAKSAGRRAEIQSQLTRVEQGIRDEERRRWKADFKTKIKVRAGGGLGWGEGGGGQRGDGMHVPHAQGDAWGLRARSRAAVCLHLHGLGPLRSPPHIQSLYPDPKTMHRKRKRRRSRPARGCTTSKSPRLGAWSWWPGTRNSRPAAGWTSTWRSGARRMPPRNTSTWWRAGRRRGHELVKLGMRAGRGGAQPLCPAFPGLALSGRGMPPCWCSPGAHESCEWVLLGARKIGIDQRSGSGLRCRWECAAAIGRGHSMHTRQAKATPHARSGGPSPAHICTDLSQMWGAVRRCGDFSSAILQTSYTHFQSRGPRHGNSKSAGLPSPPGRHWWLGHGPVQEGL